jgi:hypothetical protein
MGTEMVTVIAIVLGVIGEGLTVTFAFLNEMVLITRLHSATTSATVPPGSVPARAPSYMALFTVCRIIATRQNSSDAKKNNAAMPIVIAVSTVTAP